MESVGVKKLKNHLSRYLRTVRQGKIIEVTVHGEPVARLVPIHPPKQAALSPRLEEQLWELVGEGFLTWSGEQVQLPEPVITNQGSGLLSDLVVEGRE